MSSPLFKNEAITTLPQREMMAITINITTPVVRVNAGATIAIAVQAATKNSTNSAVALSILGW